LGREEKKKRRKEAWEDGIGDGRAGFKNGTIYSVTVSGIGHQNNAITLKNKEKKRTKKPIGLVLQTKKIHTKLKMD
jgi:hypothetical protein